MIRVRNYASRLCIGAVVLTPLTGTTVAAGDDVREQFDNRIVANGILVNRGADHCAQFGQGFVDVGNGVCGRVRTHVRVYVGPRNSRIDPIANHSLTTTGESSTARESWTTNGTSTAALRSDGMVPGAEVTHLRVRGNLDSFDPFH